MLPSAMALADTAPAIRAKPTIQPFVRVAILRPQFCLRYLGTDSRTGSSGDNARRRSRLTRTVTNPRGWAGQLAVGYSGIVAPEPPKSCGKSLNFGNPSFMGNRVS